MKTQHKQRSLKIFPLSVDDVMLIFVLLLCLKMSPALATEIPSPAKHHLIEQHRLASLSFGQAAVKLDFNVFTHKYDAFMAGSAHAYTQSFVPQYLKQDDQAIGMEVQTLAQWSVHLGVQKVEQATWGNFDSSKAGYFIGTGWRYREMIRVDLTGAMDSEAAIEAMFRTSVSF